MERQTSCLFRREIGAQCVVRSPNHGFYRVALTIDGLPGVNRERADGTGQDVGIPSRRKHFGDERIGDALRHVELLACIGIQSRHSLDVTDVPDGHLAQRLPQFDRLAHGLFDVLPEQALLTFPGRRHGEFGELIQPMNTEQAVATT